MDRDEYNRYLASREWALLKNKVRKRSNGKCERCLIGNHDSTHHLTYERVGEELLDDLVAVCNNCHKFLSGKSEFDPEDWAMTTLTEVCDCLCRSYILMNAGALGKNGRAVLDLIHSAQDKLNEHFGIILDKNLDGKYGIPKGQKL